MAIRLELSQSIHMIEADHNKLTGKPGDASRTRLPRQNDLQHGTAIVSRRRGDLAGTKAYTLKAGVTF